MQIKGKSGKLRVHHWLHTPSKSRSEGKTCPGLTRKHFKGNPDQLGQITTIEGPHIWAQIEGQNLATKAHRRPEADMGWLGLNPPLLVTYRGNLREGSGSHSHCIKILRPKIGVKPMTRMVQGSGKGICPPMKNLFLKENLLESIFLASLSHLEG